MGQDYSRTQMSNGYGHGYGSGGGYGAEGYGGYGGGMYGRETNWCPSYEGYPTTCPRPGDSSSYTHCCRAHWFGLYQYPSCCFFPLPIETMIAVVLACLIGIATLVWLTCWCMPGCPLSNRVAQNRRRRQRNPEFVDYNKEPQFINYNKEPQATGTYQYYEGAREPERGTRLF